MSAYLDVLRVYNIPTSVLLNLTDNSIWRTFVLQYQLVQNSGFAEHSIFIYLFWRCIVRWTERCSSKSFHSRCCFAFWFPNSCLMSPCHGTFSLLSTCLYTSLLLLRVEPVYFPTYACCLDLYDWMLLSVLLSLGWTTFIASHVFAIQVPRSVANLSDFGEEYSVFTSNSTSSKAAAVTFFGIPRWFFEKAKLFRNIFIESISIFLNPLFTGVEKILVWNFRSQTPRFRPLSNNNLVYHNLCKSKYFVFLSITKRLVRFSKDQLDVRDWSRSFFAMAIQHKLKPNVCNLRLVFHPAILDCYFNSDDKNGILYCFFYSLCFSLT